MKHMNKQNITFFIAISVLLQLFIAFMYHLIGEQYLHEILKTFYPLDYISNEPSIPWFIIMVYAVISEGLILLRIIKIKHKP